MMRLHVYDSNFTITCIRWPIPERVIPEQYVPDVATSEAKQSSH